MSAIILADRTRSHVAGRDLHEQSDGQVELTDSGHVDFSVGRHFDVVMVCGRQDVSRCCVHAMILAIIKLELICSSSYYKSILRFVPLSVRIQSSELFRPGGLV